MQYGTNMGCCARPPALSQMTHKAQKKVNSITLITAQQPFLIKQFRQHHAIS
jgi:hypothetical protein